MNKNLIFVLYDSILNSVFNGQVLEPILKKLRIEKYNHACIISFESKNISNDIIIHITARHPALSVIILKRTPFIHRSFLWPAIKNLKTILGQHNRYDIIARGALSGFLTLKAAKSTYCDHLTIQARGLLAQEYQHEHVRSFWLHQLHTIRSWCYHDLEHITYTKKNLEIPYTIESVSTALGEYLINTFGTDPKHLQLAQEDIPEKIVKNQVDSWKKETRKQLNIPHDATVYCFSGALKSWQNPLPIIEYFVKQYHKNNKNFLLVLSQDSDRFTQILKQHVPPHAYYAAHIPHELMYTYLAAADNGLIFREPGIISWTARPVKAMEYEAVGLHIIHNNTVQWLIDRHGYSNEFMT